MRPDVVKPAPRTGTYHCAACHEDVEYDDEATGWSEEKALAESESIFGYTPPEQREIVCDDCRKAMGFK